MEQRRNRLSIGINLLLLVLLIAAIIFLTIKYAPGITNLVKNPGKFRTLLLSLGLVSIPVFIGLQAVQVVITAIPGELVQLAGGYVFGTFLGTVYSTAGIILGSVIAFYIARLLGFRLIKNFLSPNDLERLDMLINSPKIEITLFLLFLIPGIPKDILVYLAGFTPIDPWRFFILFTIARFPGLLATSFIGSNIQERDYLPVIIVSIIGCILFVIGLFRKDWIIHKIHSLLHKESPEKDGSES